jgi:hypothetical protein
VRGGRLDGQPETKWMAARRRSGRGAALHEMGAHGGGRAQDGVARWRHEAVGHTEG